MAKKPIPEKKKAGDKPPRKNSPKAIGARRRRQRLEPGAKPGPSPERKTSVAKKCDSALTLLTELQELLLWFGITLTDPEATDGCLTVRSSPSQRHHAVVTLKAEKGEFFYSLTFPTEPDQQTAMEGIVESKIRMQCGFSMGIRREGCGAKDVVLQIASNLRRALTAYVVGRAEAPQIVAELEGRLQFRVHAATSGSLTF